MGSWKVRWGIGRTDYIVPPGLYAVGSPHGQSPVVVTANYKMSYDSVRQALAGRDVWLLVLETYGINVWCAAGKGTFGTGELIKRFNETGLSAIVQHRQLILPVLGAPGIAAHEVTKATGFKVVYATVRAADLPAFLDNNDQPSTDMRELSFSVWDRLVLIPIELVLTFKLTFAICLIAFCAGWAMAGVSTGWLFALAYLGAVWGGVVVTPLLLSWLPCRSFILKGAQVGLLWSCCVSVLLLPHIGGIGAFSFIPALTPVTAFYALNFTGSTPFTSPSGVRQEMNRGFPMMLLSLGVAMMLWGWLYVDRLF